MIRTVICCNNCKEELTGRPTGWCLARIDNVYSVDSAFPKKKSAPELIKMKDQFVQFTKWDAQMAQDSCAIHLCSTRCRTEFLEGFLNPEREEEVILRRINMPPTPEDAEDGDVLSF